MFNLPIFVGIDYHTHTIQVCVMDAQQKILVNQSVANDRVPRQEDRCRDGAATTCGCR
jgi:hypothetical protein